MIYIIAITLGVYVLIEFLAVGIFMYKTKLSVTDAIRIIKSNLSLIAPRSVDTPKDVGCETYGFFDDYDTCSVCGSDNGCRVVNGEVKGCGQYGCPDCGCEQGHPE